MKRLLFLFISLVLVVSCNSDDNSSTELREQQLAVIPNKSEVEVGGYVKFSITLDNKKEKGSELFIGDTQIYTPHMFEQVGTYQVVAKKKGCKDSEPIEIVVKEAVGTNLVLSIENKVVLVGDKINFVVKDNKGNLVKNAKIYNKATGNALSGFDYRAQNVGTFVFIAKADGYKDSQELTINVKPTFTINNKEYAVDLLAVNVDMDYIINKQGNEQLVDQVYFLRDGSPANQYVFNIISRDGEDFNLLSLTFYVANSSIIMDGVEVLDYGRRILPSNQSEIELIDIFAVTDVDFIVDTVDGISDGTLGKYTVSITECDIPKNGVGVGKDGIEGSCNFTLSYQSEDNSVNVNYNGELFFSEDLPKDSEKLIQYLKLKL